MLTSRTEKQLHGEWNRQRNKALADPTSFTATGERYALDDLNVSNDDGGVNNVEAFLIDSSPVDGTAKTNKIDIRTLPGFD